MKKIALLFLIYDEINQEELWYNWLKNIDKDKYSIYIHYKFNKELKYFEQYKLNNCIATDYCKTSIVKAHNLLFKEALKDENNYKFINLSQACIPIKTFDYIYTKLINDNYSYFNITSGDIESELFPRCNDLLNHFDKSVISKSANWIILNREIAELVVYNEEKILPLFENIYCPEEHYFIMIALINNKQNSIIIKNNLDKINFTTFTNWFYNKKYLYHDTEYNTIYYKRGLKNYCIISINEIKYLIEETECLFARKFNKSCNVFTKKPRKYESINDFMTNYFINIKT